MKPSEQTSGRLSRRRFVQTVTGLGLASAGASLLAGCSSLGTQAVPAIGAAGPEVTRIRVPHGISLCQSPLLLAGDAMRSEGFTEIEYVDVGLRSGSSAIRDGLVDIGLDFSGPGLPHVDAGAPVVFLGGAHVGCFELFGTSQIRAIRDLKGKTAFVERHPAATKRAVRAILTAADVCASQPERAAQRVADRGIADRDTTLQSLRELPYNVWREYDPEDTIRFYSLLLQQVGMVKSTPDRIIQNGTDWRFLNDLKRELKA